MTAVRAVTEPRFTLAEGPVWDAARNRLLWVDIPEGLVLVAHLAGDALVIDTEHHFDQHVGAVVPGRDGTLLVAETSRLTRVELDGTRTTLVDLDLASPDDRLNDGICDAGGRVLVGTLSRPGRHRRQRLLQVDAGAVTVLDDGLGLANGLGFSPDGSTLYSIDSVPGTVWRRDYDQSTGATGPPTVLLDLSPHTPDGMAVDSDGRLWIAMWGLGEVRCYSSAGDLEQTISVPAPHTTSVAFVGDDLDLLVITTAREGLTDAQLAEFPLSGSLFVGDPGCRGLPPFTSL